VEEIETGRNAYRQLYNWRLSIEEKIHTIATEIYGAGEVNFTSKARTQLKEFARLGMEELPVCMAKTQKSFSEDEKKVGRPTGFAINIREFELAAGAGFVVAIVGDMMRMPGLPNVPASEGMDIDELGNITGLS
jgi:formate--tetrahydrofolate ligase